MEDLKHLALHQPPCLQECVASAPHMTKETTRLCPCTLLLTTQLEIPVTTSKYWLVCYIYHFKDGCHLDFIHKLGILSCMLKLVIKKYPIINSVILAFDKQDILEQVCHSMKYSSGNYGIVSDNISSGQKDQVSKSAVTWRTTT